MAVKQLICEGKVIRRRRQEPTIDPETIALEDGAAIELRGDWKEASDSRRFWSRADIPAEYRPQAEPDPRAVLGMDHSAYLDFARRCEEWQDSRRAWLLSLNMGD